ncbi:MAG: DUF5668 domain-containing protein [Acidobacteriota bacterium]|jgi:hypothetical protein|nr:DUF5668 domain-containing protein [Acidobacteriota bacterium]
MSGNRIDAIFTGILFLTLGILFLLDNMNVIHFSLWRLFARFWPTILIYIGLKNIVLHLIERE